MYVYNHLTRNALLKINSLFNIRFIPHNEIILTFRIRTKSNSGSRYWLNILNKNGYIMQLLGLQSLFSAEKV